MIFHFSYPNIHILDRRIQQNQQVDFGNRIAIIEVCPNNTITTLTTFGV
jgi:hypothetical protein